MMEPRPLFSELLPPGIEVVVAGPDDHLDDSLFPEEQVAIARAVEKRRREFILGRACARVALARLGVTPGAIPVAADRAPVWPPDVVGSITHCAGLAAAAVAHRRSFRGVGIDAEPADPLEDPLARLICTRQERERTAEWAAPHGTNWTKIVFSAKESVHKVVAPALGVTLGFQDVEIDFPEAGRFRVRQVGMRQPRLELVELLSGRWMVDDGYVATAAVLADVGD